MDLRNTRSKRSAAGFTLIELMISVAIIGILAATSVTGFNFFQMRSRRTEAFTNLASIRTVQFSFFHEAGSFTLAPPSPALGALGKNKQMWQETRGTFSSVPGLGFDALGWSPEGATFFDYDTNAATGANGPMFTAAAYGDADGDGAISAFMYVHPDSVGASLPSMVGGFVAVWDPASCNVLLDTVAQVHWAAGGCGFTTADDF